MSFGDDERSKKGRVAFFSLDDHGLSVFDLREDGEKVMIGEVPSLDVELIEHSTPSPRLHVTYGFSGRDDGGS